MAKIDSDVTWTDVDVTTFAAAVQTAYANYKDAQRKAASLREQFETAAREGLPVPQGMRVVFGYRFGKLSAALVPDDRKPVKAKQATGTLADFIATQAAQGRGC